MAAAESTPAAAMAADLIRVMRIVNLMENTEGAEGCFTGIFKVYVDESSEYSAGRLKKQ